MTTETDIRALVEGARLPPPPIRQAIRVAAGLSVIDIAQLVGCSRLSVYRWEAGTSRPSGDLRRRYVGVLKTIQIAGAE